MGGVLFFGVVTCLGVACLRWPRYAFFAIAGPFHPKYHRTGQPITREDLDGLTDSEVGLARIFGMAALVMGIGGGAIAFLSSR